MEGFRRFANHLLGIERDKLALMFENSPVDDDGVDIIRIGLLYQQECRIEKRRDVEIISSYQDQVGALTGRERTDPVGSSRILRGCTSITSIERR